MIRLTENNLGFSLVANISFVNGNARNAGVLCDLWR